MSVRKGGSSVRKSKKKSTVEITSDSFLYLVFGKPPKQRIIASFLEFVNNLDPSDLEGKLDLISKAVILRVIPSSTVSDGSSDLSQSLSALSEEAESVTLCRVFSAAMRSATDGIQVSKMDDSSLMSGTDSSVVSRDTVNQLKRDLVGIGVSKSAASMIVSKSCECSISIRNELFQSGSALSLPRFTRLRWRLDIAISSSELKKVLRPSLVLSLTLSDGRILNMECSIHEFHQFRFNVARALREMQLMDANSQRVQ